MTTTTATKADQKYPHSANLFQFCRAVLDRKFGGIRVIDQDVGQILGFDPADCSHWKKGKKNIKSIQAMKKIADHLGVDESLVIDVAAGEITNSEALFEVDGYGSFSLDHKTVDKAKKEYYKANAHQWSQHKDQHIHSVLSHNNQLIDEIVIAIHEKIQFTEAPLYLPEIVTCYPKLTLKVVEGPAKDAVAQPRTGATRGQTGRAQGGRGRAAMPIPSSMGTGLVTTTATRNHGMEVSYPFDNNMRPYLRFQIAKAFLSFFSKTPSWPTSAASVPSPPRSKISRPTFLLPSS